MRSASHEHGMSRVMSFWHRKPGKALTLAPQIKAPQCDELFSWELIMEVQLRSHIYTDQLKPQERDFLLAGKYSETFQILEILPCGAGSMGENHKENKGVNRLIDIHNQILSLEKDRCYKTK
jgi:hypothetical protein